MTATEAPRLLGALHHAAFRCRDAEQTRWFYEDVLGLEAAAGLVLDVVPGLEVENPYMHIFFQLGDGNYVAFFDAPYDAEPEDFDRKDSFDLHVAIQAADMEHLLEMQQRIRSHGVKCAGPVDHGFVKSIYMYDPNGIQVEITVRDPSHDQVMAEEKAALRETLSNWSARTRAQKLSKFGAEALDRRASAPRSIPA